MYVDYVLIREYAHALLQAVYFSASDKNTENKLHVISRVKDGSLDSCGNVAFVTERKS